ncbi:MAG: WYL domain-containing protein [Ruminococcus sp.]|nr:WYL domain-containing protein [Ruminococcus sp.]
MDNERILHIYECLCRCTDDQHGITIKDIQNYLSKNADMDNVSALTIRRDIQRLETAGYNIKIKAGPHNTAYYSIKRLFSFNELRFIVNSIFINKFLSYGQKKYLAEKFKCICADKDVSRLIKEASIGRMDTQWDLMSNLDTVHMIIENKNKINFDYGKFNTKGEMVYYRKNRDMIPVKVVYFSARYYLKCFDVERKTFRTYRIDRMKNIKAGEKAGTIPELPVYNGAVLDMFEPEYFENVTLRVRRFLIDDMFEWLGDNASIRDDFDNNEYVVVNAYVGISHGFYKWVMKYGKNMEIISTEKVRRKFLCTLKEVLRLYERK